MRTTYQGANPISDVWARRAVEMTSRNILRAIRDQADDEARADMLLAATFAGVGFGNAGVHLCHGMSYPVSGLVKTLSCGRVSAGAAAGAARHVGHSHRAGRVQVDG